MSGDGLNSFEINRQMRQQEELEKRIQAGIAMAQNAPIDILTIHNYAAAVIDAEGGEKRAIAIMLPDGHQVRLVMAKAMQTQLHRELGEGLSVVLD